MNRINQVLAYRYAHSYLRVYSDDLSLDMCKKLKYAISLLKRNKQFLALVAAPWIAQEQRCAIVATLFDSLGLPASFCELCPLLGSKQRLGLLPDVIDAIAQLYKKNNAFMECTISTAHPLTDEQKAEIVSVMTARTLHHLIPTFVIDPSLIGGVRFTSSTYLWQDTIVSRLQRIKSTIFQETRYES